MDRGRPKHFVEPSPSAVQPKMSVQDTIKREVQHDKERKEITVATGFLDKFIALLADYSFSTARSHKRLPVASSARKPQEIVAEVRAFFGAPQRPWRPAGNRAKPTHKVRYRYRKEAA